MIMRKKTLLASAIALTATVYLPTASALGTDTFTVSAAGTYTPTSTITDTLGYGTIASYLSAANGSAFDFIIHFKDPIVNAVLQSGNESWNFAFDKGAFSNIQSSFNGAAFSNAPIANGAYDVISTAIATSTANGVPFTTDTTLEIKGTESLNAGTSAHYTIDITSSGITGQVPEPEQLSLFLIGLPLISWLVRRKQMIKVA
ncbi:PEP-CTERM sorting domain-containing protein [Methylomonas sp. AM2-LC]|uniref:PEP-CTERM sorting domain-containing protein n=1 Tax=Methylomonas sp. AM2-LC TaxID=3153301 RepID=UPI00326616BB